MTLRLRTCVALLLLLPMSVVCGDGRVGDGRSEVRDGSLPGPTRFIAVIDSSVDCTAFTDLAVEWESTRLFLDSPTVPVLFGRYCVVEWTGSDAPDLSLLPTGVVRIDPDFDILVPQATPTQTLGQLQYERALRGWGAEPTLAADWSSEGAPYVAIIDTADSTAIGDSAPSYSAVAPAQRHAIVMRAVIEAIRCPSGDSDCLDRQFFRQAFPYGAQGELDGTTGHRGSLGSLAVAIVEAVDHWKGNGDGSALINSMSLGWDPSFTGGPSFAWVPSEPGEGSGELGEGTVVEADGEPWDLPQGEGELDLISYPSPSVPAPVQAVHAALTLAACEGALSVAAAGNDRGLRCEQQGPMAPAAWESHDLLISECEALGFDTSAIEVRPLVHAAGGLDAQSRPIANALAGSMPARALYAHQVAVPVGGGGYSEPLTGTSLAAAALAGIVAELRAQNPGLSVHDVMPTLDASGSPTNELADWGPSSGQPVLRIDAHSALDPGQGGDRYLPRTQALLDAMIPSISAATATVVATTAPSIGTARTSVTLHETDAATTTSWSIYAPAGASGNLPLRQLLDDELRPQPHVPICPNCPIYKTGINQGYSLLVQPNALVVGNNTIVDVHVALTDPTIATNLDFSLGFIPTTSVVVPLDQYSISGVSCPNNAPNPTNVSLWLQCHPNVTVARVGMILGGPNPQVVTNVVDILP